MFLTILVILNFYDFKTLAVLRNLELRARFCCCFLLQLQLPGEQSLLWLYKLERKKNKEKRGV